MIQTKKELILLLPQFYDTLHLPVFLLDKNLLIQHQTSAFPSLKIDAFQKILFDKHIDKSKISFYFSYNTVYMFFPFKLENICYVCLGPLVIKKVTAHDSPNNYDFLKQCMQTISSDTFLGLPSVSQNISNIYHLVYTVITGNVISKEELKESFHKSESHLKMDNALQYESFSVRENPLHSYSYQYEEKILKYILNGNSTMARVVLKDLLQFKDGIELSTNHLQSAKYKAVSAVTVFTRTVISANVSIAKAYALSDVYIKLIDHCEDLHQILKTINDAITDFTKLVQQYKYLDTPPWIKKIKEYISHNLHQDITLSQLSEVTGMNPSYMSAQFKKITSQTIKEYIHTLKVQEAQYLIKNTNYTLSEIAIILNFSSQSHFNSIFKRITNQSPMQFKKNKN